MSESTPTVLSDTNGAGLRIALGDIRDGGQRSMGTRVEAALRDAIRDGRLHAGTTLPATRSLAADLGVSRGVVVRAYEQLVAEGYLTARTGRGTVVADIHIPTAMRSVPAEPVVPGNPGLPALRGFPRRAWLRALETAMAEMSDADLGYGDPRGHPRLRQALAGYLGRTRAVVAHVDQIVVTAGFAQGSRLIAEALARHGVHDIGVEDPGSVGVVATLRVGGLRTHPVPVDAHGLQVAALATGDLRAVMVTPAHQFPTGAVLAPERRSALLDWAGRRQGVVVEDDYDAEYRYDRSPVGALQGLAPELVIYGGSVSKTLAPGLRLGWVVAPEWFSETLADVKHYSDIAAPALDQIALAVFIETGGLDRHIRRMATRYAQNRRCLLEAVDRHLPGWHVTGIAAGLHAVLVPPADTSPDDLAAVSAGELDVVALSTFTQGEGPHTGLVVGYAAATPDQIVRGVRAVAAQVS